MNKELLHSEYAKVWHKDTKMTDYCTNKAAETVELPTGELLIVEKQHIEKRFCFGESGYDYEDAVKAAAHARTSAAYFKRENMKHFEELLNLFNNDNYMTIIYTGPAYYSQDADCRLRHWGYARLTDILDACGGSARIAELPGRELEISCQSCRIATAEEVAAIRDAVVTAAKAHEKKVDSYLKRYGTSQVRAWTYWLDA